MGKYICIFCDERKNSNTAYKLCGNIGICRGCYEKLDKTPPAMPYNGLDVISYIMSSFEYTGALRRVILDFKFHNNWSYAPLLADIMREYLNSYGDIWNDFDYIVPVPLHESRLKERGYNQSELLSEPLSKFLKIPMRTDFLYRTRDTKRQSSLKRIDRVLNVKDAFECRTDLNGKNILLFDDICTTGNTLLASAQALHRSHAKSISTLTLAIHVVNKLPIITY